MDISKEEIHEHLWMLMRRTGFSIRIDPRLIPNGRVDFPTRQITLKREPDTEAMYAVALHEFGHAAELDIVPHAQPDVWSDIMLTRFGCAVSTARRERRAWQWARRAARVWTAEMDKRAQESYGSYLIGAPIELKRELTLWEEGVWER